jgi:hypothetical protein
MVTVGRGERTLRTMASAALIAGREDQNGAADVEAAIAEALKRCTPQLAAVRHAVEHRRYERGLPPVAGRDLPIDERVQGLVGHAAVSAGNVAGAFRVLT